jgi:hypothetical protein
VRSPVTTTRARKGCDAPLPTPLPPGCSSLPTATVARASPPPPSGPALLPSVPSTPLPRFLVSPPPTPICLAGSALWTPFLLLRGDYLRRDLFPFVLAASTRLSSTPRPTPQHTHRHIDTNLSLPPCLPSFFRQRTLDAESLATGRLLKCYEVFDMQVRL